MKHSVLDDHAIIAWDIDGTLFQGRNAANFCAYIRAHPEKTHHLVTFRDPAWALEAYRDLDGAVPRAQIAGIHACPPEIWAAQFSNKITASLVQECLSWKGMMAASLGATILIDDMEHMVEAGCEKHGVTFLHAHAPWSDHA